MRVGLGSGSVSSATPGVSCGSDCDQSYPTGTVVTLTATAAAGSTFVAWHGDCAGVVASSCNVTLSGQRSVRAEFALTPVIPQLSDFTPTGIASYLTANPSVSTPERFLDALPDEYKLNWLMMTRSESLQTGTAEHPRFILPSVDAQNVFAFSFADPSGSYPGSHPSAVEYMQYDAAQKNFRFHEILLAPIPPLGTIPARTRGVSEDDNKCYRCHSTRNVLNRGATPGTTGVPIGSVQHKSKPNWDAYDSWGGAMPFNRDRVYRGSVEAASFRRLLDPWTFRDEPSLRAFVEQLALQPAGVPAEDAVTRIEGGEHDGHIAFAFDTMSPVLIEPPPIGMDSPPINYVFDGVAGIGVGSAVVQGAEGPGNYVRLHHSADPTNDEGRAVQLFDLLGGLDGNLNQSRVADELAHHRFATGNVPIDVRPIALAIARECLSIDVASNAVVASTPLTLDQSFFVSRHGGLSVNDLVNDTRLREQSLPRRKADAQANNLNREFDTLYTTEPIDGLLQMYGAFTSTASAQMLPRIRQEVFQRSLSYFQGDSTVMGGFYVDREFYGYNTDRVALYRFFLEPLGVSVDKWSMGVRGRSRTYAFADVMSSYTAQLQTTLSASLDSDPVPGLSAPYTCASLIAAVNSTLGSLPAAAAVPTYTDVQRIFNKSCIECHGGLGYPPAAGTDFSVEYLDLSEDEAPAAGMRRLDRSHGMASSYAGANPSTSTLYQRITDPDEHCPNGMMPCGGPALSQADIATIRRWIDGSTPNTWGDPHLTTVDGTKYDFQSAGEFVLLRDVGFELQVRQERVATEAPLPPDAHTGLSSCASLNTAAALRVGPHRITVQPKPRGDSSPESLEVRVDGRLVRVGPRSIALARGGRILATPAAGGVQVQLPGGTDVVITPGYWDYYRVWYLTIDIRHARATEGVMGAIAPGSWLPALPDGGDFGPRPSDLHERYEQLYVKFADAWRVDDKTSLFDYAAGTSTATFSHREWPGEEPKECSIPGQNLPPKKQLTLAAAKDVCADVGKNKRENCMQDVMVTGERNFAKTYLTAQQILQNRVGKPVELRSPANNSTDLATSMTFQWSATRDPDQDPLTYYHCVWPSKRAQTFRDCRAVPTRDGEMSTTVNGLTAGEAYSWKVIVDDGRAGSVESSSYRFTTK